MSSPCGDAAASSTAGHWSWCERREFGRGVAVLCVLACGPLVGLPLVVPATRLSGGVLWGCISSTALERSSHRTARGDIVPSSIIIGFLSFFWFLGAPCVCVDLKSPPLCLGEKTMRVVLILIHTHLCWADVPCWGGRPAAPLAQRCRRCFPHTALSHASEST
jgi:hypothetical protein